MRSKLFIFILVIGLSGCASIPPVSSVAAKAGQEIKSHVRFLSQPELRGRKPGTQGSRIARRYIESRFKAYGLTPWGNEPGYERPFGYGKNIVAALPGSDPDLAREIVIVSAHYDHLGKDLRGRICPGAADNASGVAAMLEVAKELSASRQRPKRTILFVAFDCEEMMLFGSFAFSCRTDVHEAKIAAVVNVDMLGRDFFDVVPHTLFVVGAEQYPNTRARICGYGNQAGIRVLPLGSDLIGPRSDHVAFESRGIPCLFFTCGTFRDYHEPSDTADKLNYKDIKGSADVLMATVGEFANSRPLEPKGSAADGYADELQTIHTIMSEVNNRRVEAGIKQEDAESFKKLAEEADDLLGRGRYDRAMRNELVVDAAGILAPYFLPADITGKRQTNAQRQETKLTMQYLQQFYVNYRAEMMEGYRRLVAQLLKYRPGLVRGMPKFNYEFYDIPDSEINLAERARDRYELNALANCWSMMAEIKHSKFLLKSFNCYMGSSLEPLDCTGTREQIADYCLLRLRAGQSNTLQSTCLKKVLRATTGAESSGTYGDLLTERLQRGGFRDESEWIRGCMLSDAPELAVRAIESANTRTDAGLTEIACRLMPDAGVRADVRAAAIALAAKCRTKGALLGLCDRVSDPTPAYQREFMPMLRKEYPFADLISVKAVKPIVERQFKPPAEFSKTLGDLAEAQLKKLTKRNFGKDPQRWRAWIASHPVAANG